MSRLREQKCHACWSNPTLRKSYSLYWTPTLEEEMPSPYQAELVSPYLSIAQRYTPLIGTVGYCLCNKQKSLSSLYNPHDIKAIL